MDLEPTEIDFLIELALAEDLGSGDITTNNILDADMDGSAVITCRQDGVIAGLPVALAVFKKLDPNLTYLGIVKDGEQVIAGTALAEIRGKMQALLSGERTALNFLQQLSAIATKTSSFVHKVSKYNVKILDTRKTVPGLRKLAKYAVRVGGGFNHRFGLYDAAMIKDNHIKAAGNITSAVQILKQTLPVTTRIEVEAESLAEVREALQAGADIIMLDNMTYSMIKDAVALVDGKTLLEASGGINLTTAEEIASTGVDFISIGELTNSINALDINMELLD